MLGVECVVEQPLTSGLPGFRGGSDVAMSPSDVSMSRGKDMSGVGSLISGTSLECISAEHPEIRFDNTESDQETIIDIRTKDKLGLLYAISTILYELGLNISLAKVTTQAMMAIDSFYISDQNGEKIRDGIMMEEIRHKLTEKLIS